jgi:rhomboid-like protein
MPLNHHLTTHQLTHLLAPLTFAAIAISLSVFLLSPSSIVPPPPVPTTHDPFEPTPALLTCAAITAVNLAIFLLWRNPHVWHTMNRHFILTAGATSPISLLTAVFSHQRWIWHLAVNTALLFSIGMPLHDEVGTANLLGIYLASGVFANAAALTFHVARRNALYASLGASGAVLGLFGAYNGVQEQRKLTIPFWGESVECETWLLVVGLGLCEVMGMVVSRSAKLDHVNHIAGLTAGWALGRLLRMRDGTGEDDKTSRSPENTATEIS